MKAETDCAEMVWTIEKRSRLCRKRSGPTKQRIHSLDVWIIQLYPMKVTYYKIEGLLQKELDCKQEKILKVKQTANLLHTSMTKNTSVKLECCLGHFKKIIKIKYFFNSSSTFYSAFIIILPSILVCNPFLCSPLYLCPTELCILSACTSFIQSLPSHWKTALHSPVFLLLVCPSSCPLLLAYYQSLS